VLPEPNTDKDKVDNDHNAYDWAEQSYATHHTPVTIIIHHMGIIARLFVFIHEVFFDKIKRSCIDKIFGIFFYTKPPPF